MPGEIPEPEGGARGLGSPPVGSWLRVGGTRLALERSGSAGPAVIFLPGAGLIGLDYLNLHRQVSQFTTSVIYDRAGTGWSDPIELPRPATEVVSELRALLGTAQIRPPWVLVGHSLGGAYARLFAQLFPAEIAGLVLLDPAHEAYLSLPRPSLLAQLRQAIAFLGIWIRFNQVYRPLFDTMFAQWPGPLRELLVRYHLKHWRVSLREARNLRSEVLDQIRVGGKLSSAPLIVLTAMGIDPFMELVTPREQLRQLNRRKLAFYTDFAASVTGGENRPIEHAGHSTIHTDRPDAVIQAIQDVLERARATGRTSGFVMKTIEAAEM